MRVYILYSIYSIVCIYHLVGQPLTLGATIPGVHEVLSMYTYTSTLSVSMCIDPTHWAYGHLHGGMKWETNSETTSELELTRILERSLSNRKPVHMAS